MITPLDRWLNKLKRKGFFLYLALIVGSVAYGMYSMGDLANVSRPKQLKDQKKNAKAKDPKFQDQKKSKQAKDLKNQKKDAKDPSQDRHQANNSSLQPTSLEDIVHDKLESNELGHMVDTLDRPQLYSFLTKHRIYLSVDLPLEVVRERARQVYDSLDPPVSASEH